MNSSCKLIVITTAYKAVRAQRLGRHAVAASLGKEEVCRDYVTVSGRPELPAGGNCRKSVTRLQDFKMPLITSSRLKPGHPTGTYIFNVPAPARGARHPPSDPWTPSCPLFGRPYSKDRGN